ncbi:hypothetical protein SAMN05421640_2366 [Ekhidna lutea]|uniref:Uncharacterized protein n=1 Tax=Ekhidna lutea TaxID=447679 RepID=A0A239K0Z9_EKHLU|nr:hypothetical protein [Ekhidna lutea]SNT11996.1 hypothetical protein SAMN05421640_2366 [Ekhidna lutea]
MKPFLFILIIHLFVNQIFCQKSCPEFQSSTENYWPLTPGIENNFKLSRDTKITVILNDSIEFQSKFYRIRRETFLKDGRTEELYFRKENGTIYSYDLKQNLESIALPANPEVGMKWETADRSWS